MAPMKLTEARKRELRSRNHPLRSYVYIATAGVSAAVLNELEGALDHHELIKVKVRAPDRDERNARIGALTRTTGAVETWSCSTDSGSRPARGLRTAALRRSPP